MANGIWYDALGGPIPPTYHVPSSGGGDTAMSSPTKRTLEEGGTVTVHDDLRRTLAGTIWVIPTHGIVLTICIYPFVVLVAFIAGYDDTGSNPFAGSDRLQQVDRAHDIRPERVHRVLIGPSHQRLGRQMEDDVRLERAEVFLEIGEIVDIPYCALHPSLQVQRPKETWLLSRLEGIAVDLRPQMLEPGCQPTSLEPGMAGEKYPLPPYKRVQT